MEKLITALFFASTALHRGPEGARHFQKTTGVKNEWNDTSDGNTLNRRPKFHPLGFENMPNVEVLSVYSS